MLVGDECHRRPRFHLSLFRAAHCSSAQPPPLLRSFDDDWEAFRTRGECFAEQSELETAPLETDLASSVALPVSGNSTVLDRVGGCDIVLARRVGPGEVVKQLYLLPVPQR